MSLNVLIVRACCVDELAGKAEDRAHERSCMLHASEIQKAKARLIS